MSYGDALHRLRKQIGLTQQDLSAKTEVSQSMVSAIERGIKQGTEDTRRVLAEALGWPYEAMAEFGRMLAMGIDPDTAEQKAYARFTVDLPPPMIAADLEDLVGFHVVIDGTPSTKMAWVHRDVLGRRKRGNLAVHEFRETIGRVTALIDFGKNATKFRSGNLYLVKLKDSPALLRMVKGDPDVWLLWTLDGEVQATNQPWSEFVRGRVLWYQVDLGLAKK